MSKHSNRNHTSSARKLAAILFADIVGYTSLMQQDEQNASTLLRHFQKTMEAKVQSHNGRIVNFYGDGALCIFDVPIDAVRCALDLQKTFQSAPEVPVRFGTHMGTVTIEEEKVFGDNVNIASRIESMAVPGSVLLSKRIRDEIKNNPDLALQSLGNFEFKNVQEPLELFALANNGIVVPKRQELRSPSGQMSGANNKFPRWVKLLVGILVIGIGGYFIYANNSNGTVAMVIKDEKPSIVILPFDNLSNDPDQTYFASGIADEIRNALSGIDRLKVISRSSSIYFKGKNVSQKEIAETLNVNHILSGSVQQFDDQIKISVELSNAETDEVEWSLNTGQQSNRNIFDIQREIANEVSKQLRVNLNDKEFSRVLSYYSEDPEIHQKFIQNWEKMLSNDAQINIKAVETSLKEILSKEPDNVPALKALASNYMIQGLYMLPQDSAYSLAKELFEKAEALDNEHLILPGQYGAFKFWYEWDFSAVDKYLRRPNGQNGDWSLVLAYDYYMKIGELEKARSLLEKVEELNPLHEFKEAYTCRYYAFTGELDKAEEFGRSAIDKDPLFREGYFELARLYLVQNRNQEAANILEQGIKNLRAEIPYYTGFLAIAYHRLGQLDKFESIIKKLEEQYESMQAGSPAFYLGAAYCNIGETDKGFDWLEKSFEARDVEMTWLKMDPAFEPVKDDPRYKDLLNRVGFPKPLLN